MLPGDHKPWAKSLATTVIALSLLGAIGLVIYFRSVGSLHISEIVGIFLLLLTIVPPNAAIIMRKPDTAYRNEQAGLGKTSTIHTN